MSKLYSRGLNFFGQCGLGKIKHSPNFQQVTDSNDKFSRIYTNNGMSFALSNGKNFSLF